MNNMSYSIDSKQDASLVDGIQDLRAKVVTLFNRPFDEHMLGRVALEIILRRSELQRALESSSMEEKENIKKMMETLNEFEISITSLYVRQHIYTSSNNNYKLPQYYNQKYEWESR